MTVRPAAVAGTFYPGERESLEATVRDLLDRGRATVGLPPKALIVPHAGYPYSGAVAATAYRTLLQAPAEIDRVVLLGPAHRVFVEGLAFPSVDRFATPCGEIPLDRNAIASALTLPGTLVSDAAHAAEHCLEVHLPFLQAVLDAFRIVPIVVGRCEPDVVACVLEHLWGGRETLIVVSSDLSHYHPYDTARTLDARTTARILARETGLTGEEACGASAINGLMAAARNLDLSVRVLDVRNSGDTAGDRRQVVGYGAYAVG